MTKSQIINLFKESHAELLKCDDYCKKQLAWSYFIDYLCKNGEITQKQYDNIANPDFVKMRRGQNKKLWQSINKNIIEE